MKETLASHDALKKKQLKNKACTQTQIGNKTVMEYACVLNSWNIGVSYFSAVNAICYQHFFIIFFSHTQHSIQNITKQNNRHILNISKSNQKGGREGKTLKTQKSLLYIITYIQQKKLVNAICERNQSYMYVCETIQVLNPLWLLIQ